MFAASPSSRRNAHGADAYELFATSSSDNMIRLWDVRTEACVRCFSSHQSKAAGCGIDISPCLRYLAAGSEDNSLYMYDMGSGGVVKRLVDGISDGISSVAFNPVHPQLVGASMDGKLHVFGEPT